MPRALVDENVVLRRCAQYRDGFKGTAVSFPAALLRFAATRDWIQRHRVAVDVTTDGELAQAVVAELSPGASSCTHEMEAGSRPAEPSASTRGGSSCVRAGMFRGSPRTLERGSKY